MVVDRTRSDAGGRPFVRSAAHTAEFRSGRLVDFDIHGEKKNAPALSLRTNFVCSASWDKLADCDAFGSVDIRRSILGYCSSIGGERVWPTHDESLDTCCRTSPPMEHDFVHLWHHLLCHTETRRRSSTSSNPQSAVDTSRGPVDARFPDRCHCPRQHLDLCYDVQPTTRAVEVDISPTRKGDM